MAILKYVNERKSLASKSNVKRVPKSNKFLVLHNNAVKSMSVQIAQGHDTRKLFSNDLFLIQCIDWTSVLLSKSSLFVSYVSVSK